MTLLPQTLQELAAAGASLRLDVRKYSIQQLQALASAVAEGNGRLIVINAQALTPDSARTLVGIAGRAIEFDTVS